MPRFTITVSGELDDFIESQVGDGERFDSKSKAVRHYVERGRDAEGLDAEIQRLQTRLDSREQRIDTLEKQLARRSEIEEKVDVLATRVKERDRAVNAPFLVRWIRWWRDRRDGEEAAHA